MAKSGSLTKYFSIINPSSSNGTMISTWSAARTDTVFTGTFSWTTKSQSIVNNTSTIDWTYTVTAVDFSKVPSSAVMGWKGADYIAFGTDRTQNAYPYDDFNDIEISIASTIVYSTTSYTEKLYAGQTKTIASGTSTVAHADDGTLNPNVTATVRVSNIWDSAGNPFARDYGALDYGYNSKVSVTGNLNLDTIARQAVLLTAENFTDENPPTITYAIPTGATNVKAVISLNPATYSADIVKNISGSTYTFSFTDDDKAKLWSILKEGLNTKQVSFWITSTFNGASHTNGPIVQTLTIDNYTPTLDPSVTDGNDTAYALTGNRYKLIRHFSNAVFDSGAMAHKGAKITEYLAINNGKPLYSKTGTFEAVASPEFYFAATDDAGRTVETTYTIPEANWVPYIKLTCSAEVTEMTADGDVAITLRGKFFNGSFSSTKTNRMRMSYDISENNEDFDHVDKGYIYPTVDSEGNYTYTFTITGLNYLSVYELTVRVSDEVAVQGTEAHTVIASTPIFDWGRTDFNFNVPVTIQGGSVPTIIAQGTAGIWTYRTWSDGTAECWGKKDISVTFPSTANWGGLFTTGVISASNVSFPFGLFAETPVVNASLLVRSSGGILMAPGGAGSNTANMDQTGVYEIARGSYVSGSQAYTINYQVIGRWK